MSYTEQTIKFIHKLTPKMKYDIQRILRIHTGQYFLHFALTQQVI